MQIQTRSRTCQERMVPPRQLLPRSNGLLQMQPTRQAQRPRMLCVVRGQELMSSQGRRQKVAPPPQWLERRFCQRKRARRLPRSQKRLCRLRRRRPPLMPLQLGMSPLLRRSLHLGISTPYQGTPSPTRWLQRLRSDHQRQRPLALSRQSTQCLLQSLVTTRLLLTTPAGATPPPLQPHSMPRLRSRTLGRLQTQRQRPGHSWSPQLAPTECLSTPQIPLVPSIPGLMLLRRTNQLRLSAALNNSTHQQRQPRLPPLAGCRRCQATLAGLMPSRPRP